MMTIKMEDQTLSVSELFKKYDIDEISEILVDLKKQVFIRTNDIKKVIGSNPELMIEFGENVLEIYDSSKALSNSVGDLIDGIESFSDSLEERILEISKVELPNDIRCDDLIEVAEELMQESYFEILKKFSDKEFVAVYELYLKLSVCRDSQRGGGPDPTGRPSTESGYDESSPQEPFNFKYDLLFIRNSVRSHCNSLIQSCSELSGAELLQLVLIRFLVDSQEGCFVEGSLDEESSDSVMGARFNSALQNSIFLRVEEAKEGLEGISSVLQEQEANSEYFTLGIQTLMGFYELVDSAFDVISGFESKRLISRNVKMELLNAIQCSDILSNHHINELKSKITDKFSFVSSSDLSERGGESSHRALMNVYSKIYDRVVGNNKGMTFLEDCLFPILLGRIDSFLKCFIKRDQKSELLRLIVTSDANNSASCHSIRNLRDFSVHGECQHPYLQKSDFLSHYNAETFDWLNLRKRSLEFVAKELEEVEALLTKVLDSERRVKGIISYLSYGCLLSSIDSYVRFCKNVCWSFFRLGGVKRVPICVHGESKGGDELADSVNAFTNTLIQGKSLDVIENGLQKYFRCSYRDEIETVIREMGDNIAVSTKDLCDQGDDKLVHFSFHSLVPHVKYEEDFSIDWKVLLDITCEILVSIDHYMNNGEYRPAGGADMTENFVLLKPLGDFLRRYVEPEHLKRHLSKLRNLEMLIYSIIMHSENFSSKLSVFQSILLNRDGLGPEDHSSCPKRSDLEKKMMSYHGLYRRCGLDGGVNSEVSATPHSILIEITMEIVMFGMQLHSRIQRSDYDAVCRNYMETYLVPLLLVNMDHFSNLLLSRPSASLDNNEQVSGDIGDSRDSFAVTSLQRIVFSLFSDLTWCVHFRIEAASTKEPDFGDITSKYYASLSGVTVESESAQERRSVSEVLDTIKSSTLSLLCGLQNVHSFESCKEKEGTQLSSVFAPSVQRFQTLSHVKPSKYGSISNHITSAYDKDLKMDIDRNFVSKETRKDSSAALASASSNEDPIQEGGDAGVFLLTHFSDLLKAYKKNGVSFISGGGEEDCSNTLDNGNRSTLFSNSLCNEQQSGQSTGNTNANGKVEAQSIWQVPSLLKETVKDRVFGQKEDV